MWLLTPGASNTTCCDQAWCTPSSRRGHFRLWGSSLSKATSDSGRCHAFPRMLCGLSLPVRVNPWDHDLQQQRSSSMSIHKVMHAFSRGLQFQKLFWKLGRCRFGFSWKVCPRSVFPWVATLPCGRALSFGSRHTLLPKGSQLDTQPWCLMIINDDD